MLRGSGLLVLLSTLTQCSKGKCHTPGGGVAFDVCRLGFASALEAGFEHCVESYLNLLFLHLSEGESHAVACN